MGKKYVARTVETIRFHGLSVSAASKRLQTMLTKYGKDIHLEKTDDPDALNEYNVIHTREETVSEFALREAQGRFDAYLETLYAAARDRVRGSIEMRELQLAQKCVDAERKKEAKKP